MKLNMALFYIADEIIIFESKNMRDLIRLETLIVWATTL